MDDTLVSIQRLVANNQHPPVFQAVVYGIYNLFYNITGSENIGYASVTFLQLLAAASIIAYFISWLYSHKITTWVIVLAAIFLIGSPLISNYVVTVLKDTWFAFAFLLLLPNLYDFVTYRKPNIINKILFLVSIFGIWASRSNGPILVIILCLFLLVVFFKDKAKRTLLIVSSFVILLMGFCVNQVVSNRIEHDSSFRESVSIPLAQIGAVVSSEGKLSQEDQEFITEILPIEKWGADYEVLFSFVDPIKFDKDFNEEFLNEHKTEFIKTWISIMSKNPGISIRAYLFQTYGLWNLAYWDTDNLIMNQSVFQNVMNNILKEDPPESWKTGPLREWLDSTELANQPVLSPELSSVLNDYYQSTATTNMYFNAGIMILICFGCIAIIIVSKKYIYLIMFLPILLTWGSMMVATPASMIYRYSFYFLLSLPFVIITTIRVSQKNATTRLKKHRGNKRIQP